MNHLVQEILDMDEQEETNPKKAFGNLKAPANHCPPTALIELQAVMGSGAHKYGLYNFRDTKIDAMTYIGAIRRHLYLWEDGVDKDAESGRSHLAHIMACCALALDAMHTGMFVDNRCKSGKVEGLLKDCADTHNAFCRDNLSVAERELEELKKTKESRGLQPLPPEELKKLMDEVVDSLRQPGDIIPFTPNQGPMWNPLNDPWRTAPLIGDNTGDSD